MAKLFEESETTPLFMKICKMIGQPCSEGDYDAKVGDWYILTVGYHWTVWEKTSETEKKRIIDYKGIMNRWDFHHSLKLILAFLVRGNENLTASMKPEQEITE